MVPNNNNYFNCLLFVFLLLCSFVLGQYNHGDVDKYANTDWPSIRSASYTAPRPAALTNACVNKAKVGTLVDRLVSANTDSAGLNSLCSGDVKCIIQPNVVVTMNGDVNVAALVNRGTIQWTDATQGTRNEQYLCAGYFITEANGIFNLSLSNSARKAFIYIKDNNARYDSINGNRVFGAVRQGATNANYPMVSVSGTPLARTWTLLATTGQTGSNTITVIHDVSQMGWKNGDRIAIAPTSPLASQTAQDFIIQSISGSTITLSGTLDKVYRGEPQKRIQAEVMLLSRNVIITGDDFTHENPNTANCPRTDAFKCTLGLHTIFNNYYNGQSNAGGTYRMENIRVEKCGHRGITGRYCIHFHATANCPRCVARGNAVEFGQQRGIVVHNTHNTLVEHNTLYNVRGAGIYIEDGNELYNYIKYNAVLCPWRFSDPTMNGCTVPGTDNPVADTADNQAALYSTSHTNHFVGNRGVNSRNGLFYDSQNAEGRGFARLNVCARFVPLGRVEGNTLHGNSRFGTYFVSDNWPRKTGSSIADNGWTNGGVLNTWWTNCGAFDSNGNDKGSPATVWHNVDYHNDFVGSYHSGDIQYRFHTAIDNMKPTYHKETKNFADGCASHYQDYFIENSGGVYGRASLASGLGTIIFERLTMKGDVEFESSHHCMIGVTGVLCNPQYIFTELTWRSTRSRWIDWGVDNPTKGSIYNLAPPDAATNLNRGGSFTDTNFFFPPGYQGVVHSKWTHLTALPNGVCRTSSSLGVGPRFDNGILCTKPIRRLEIFTPNEVPAGGLTLSIRNTNGVEITSTSMTYGEVGGTKKRGFTIPIIGTLDYRYHVSRTNGQNILTNWIIEFSDPVIGNRWTKDEIYLTVAGRSCPSITSSQHDRRWIYGSNVDGDYFLTDKGVRGACSGQSDMPAINCANVPQIPLTQCPQSCSGGCGANSYCECGLGQCVCEAGFSGSNCATDVCASANCGSRGRCAAKYLGGTLPVTSSPCICDDGWTGATCNVPPSSSTVSSASTTSSTSSSATSSASSTTTGGSSGGCSPNPCPSTLQCCNNIRPQGEPAGCFNPSEHVCAQNQNNQFLICPISAPKACGTGCYPSGTTCAPSPSSTTTTTSTTAKVSTTTTTSTSSASTTGSSGSCPAASNPCPSTLQCCNNVRPQGEPAGCFNPSQHVCAQNQNNQFIICPVSAPKACGTGCYPANAACP